MRQAELSRRAHVAELFSKAAGQLSDDKLEVRLAAIYTLREIGRDFPDLGGVVFELLSAYLRDNRQVYPPEGELPADIREILRILPDQVERRNVPWQLAEAVSARSTRDGCGWQCGIRRSLLQRAW